MPSKCYRQCFSANRRILSAMVRTVFRELPVSDSKVLLLFQRVNEGDEKVLVIEKSGEHGDSLLYIWPGSVGWLRKRKKRQDSDKYSN